MRYLILVLLLGIANTVFAQGFFESTIKGNTEENKLGFDISGYGRGVLYSGKNLNNDIEFKNGIGELSLKFKAEKESIAKLYSDLRFKSGFEYTDKVNSIDIRELYLDLYFKKLDFRIGKQIVLWGRADGINPTNNITPQNYFVRSPEQDDMRLGNFLIKGSYDLSESIEFEAIWVPAYKESIYRYDLFEMPGYVGFVEGEFPDFRFHHSMLALKLDMQLSVLEASISYFNGYDPMMGIKLYELGINENGLFVDMQPTAYEQQTLGADFSFSLGSYGFRGELAYKFPDEDFEQEYYIPNPEFNWVLGIDKSIGDFSIIAQYLGKYVKDFQEVNDPGAMDVDGSLITDPAWLPFIETGINNQMEYFNAINFNQTKEMMHSISIRPAYNLFYETLQLELFGLYNFSTEEYMIQPMLTYNIADALNLRLGGQYYYGDKGTQFEMLDHIFNSVFLELKYSF